MVAVAFSGGLDSTALLHATVAAAAPLGLSVLALHVHHGLSPQADRWEDHAARLCARWTRRGKPVAFASHRAAGKPVKGESVEAWARRVRYRALRAMAFENGATLVLLAHHRRDQAETFLLQALRAGGVEALSAMPRIAHRDGITWSRPWLDQPREAIEAYARRHRLRWVDDESNADPRFARNRLRRNVWPALLEAFPDAESTLSGAALRAQEGAAAIAAWAEHDQGAVVDGALDIARWRALPDVRQRHLLRLWLREVGGGTVVLSTLLDRLLLEVPAAGSRRWPFGETEVRSHRGRLHVPPAGRAAAAGEAASGVDGWQPIDLSRPGRHTVSGCAGSFEVHAVREGGIPRAMAAALATRPRRPADRFQAGPGRPARSLKLQFQAAGVPAWERLGPLLCHGEQLVFVASLGTDARALEAPGTPRVAIDWHPA